MATLRCTGLLHSGRNIKEWHVPIRGPHVGDINRGSLGLKNTVNNKKWLEVVVNSEGSPMLMYMRNDVDSQQRWFWVFLFHKFSHLTPPPTPIIFEI